MFRNGIPHPDKNAPNAATGRFLSASGGIPLSADIVRKTRANERHGMPTLRIQHSVPNFEGWKRAFDSDPADRKGSGVRRYSVSRSVDDQNLVMIDLEFDDAEGARALLGKMERIWQGPGKDVMQNPVAWIVETVETIDL